MFEAVCNMISFIGGKLVSFLSSEPIIYFVALMIVAIVVSLLFRLLNWR